MKPTKRGGSVPCTRPTASSAENSLPSRRFAEQLASDADDARLAGLDVVTQVVVVLGAIRLGQQDVHLQPDDFFFVVAEHALARVVEQLDAALMIEQHDRIDRRIEHRLEFAFQTLRAFFLRFGRLEVRSWVRHSSAAKLAAMVTRGRRSRNQCTES